MIDAIGYLAATLTTVAFVPQARLTWKTRRADGVSRGMYTVFALGVALWLVYRARHRRMADRRRQRDHAGAGTLHPRNETALRLN